MNPSYASRIRRAAYQRSRYWNDPDYRLQRINSARRSNGLPPRETLDAVLTTGRRV